MGRKDCALLREREEKENINTRRGSLPIKESWHFTFISIVIVHKALADVKRPSETARKTTSTRDLMT